MLSNVEITAKIHQLKEWETMEAELKAEIESLKDELKAELVTLNTEELTVETDTEINIIRYTSILSNRFDTTAFKRDMPETYKAYTKQISSKRFTIA